MGISFLKDKFPFFLKVLKYLCTIVIFLFIGFSIKWNDFFIGVTQLSLAYVCIAFSFCFLHILVLGIRWYLMIRLEFSQPLHWHLIHFFKASFFNLITPAAVGSDVYRLVAMKNSKQDLSILAGFLIRERVIGFLGFCLFYLICLSGYIIEKSFLLTPSVFKDIGLILSLCGIIFVCIHLNSNFVIKISAKYLPKSWRVYIDQFNLSFNYRSMMEFVCLATLTLLGCLSWVMGAYFLTLSFDSPVPFLGIGLVCVVSEFSRWLPLTPQGVGIRESVFGYGFSLIGFLPEQGFLVGGVIYILNSIALIFLASLSVCVKNVRKNIEIDAL